MSSKLTVQERRALVRARYNHPENSARPWRKWFSAENLLTNLVRLGFLLAVFGVLLGTWVVADAHLTEQFLGTPREASGLINPTAEENALTPEYIEKQVLALNLRMREDELLIPAGTNPQQRPFAIVPGEPGRFVAQRLAGEGFILDADLFNLYLRVTGLERRIEAGNFILAETMTIPQIAESLQNALFEEIPVTIPEGFRAEEIAERLSQNNVMEPDRFLAAVRAPQSLSIFEDYDFLQDLPPGASLEGFLFPDTYRFPVFASTPELVLAPFLNNFEAKVGTDGLRAGAGGLSGRNLITMASIVEREAVQADERPLIASVYLNRLNGRCAAEVGGNYLQADPTVQYARGAVGNWWWKPQRIEEYATVTGPYNTYLAPGLPPGPIASPGLSAIESTQNPEPSDLCFFVATGDDGRHVFARTLAEHQQNLQIYGYQ